MKFVKFIFVLLCLASVAKAQTVSNPDFVAAEAPTVSLRNSYPVGLRKWGMLITVYADLTSSNNKTWYLQYNHASISKADNNNWVDAATVFGGTSAVTSVFTRTGDITAQSSDYSAFYPLLSGAYANPTWITSLAGTKITLSGGSGQLQFESGGAMVGADFLTTSGGRLKIGALSPFTAARRLEVQENSSPAALTLPLRLTGVGASSTTPGTGVGFEFALANTVFGEMDLLGTSLVPGNESGDMVFKNISAGVLAEKFRIKSTGDFFVGGTSGTSGQFLKSNGSGSAPSWATLSGITGSLTSGRIPVANGSSTITDFSTFTYIGSVLSVNSVTLKSPNGSGSGDPNLFLGNGAGVNSPTNGYNTAIGYNNLNNLSSGQFNTSFGAFALSGNTTGNQNTAFGYLAMGNNFPVTGGNNVAVGRAAGQNVNSGTINVFVGDASGNANTSGSQNTFVGRISGLANTTANDNTFIGYTAGSGNTTGYSNTFVGSGAATSAVTTHEDVALGFQVAQNYQGGSENTFLGNFTLGESQNRTSESVVIGSRAWSAWGSFNPNVTGLYQTIVGTKAGGYISSGNYNLVLGYRASSSDDPTVAIKQGSQNIAIGYRANVADSAGNGQLSIQNSIYGTNNTLNVTGDAIALGKIGFYTKAPNSKLHVDGSFSTGYNSKSANYTLTDLDYSIEVTTGTNTQTLPTAVGIKGRSYFITNTGSGVVTVATTSSQTFANVVTTPTTLTLNQYGGILVQSNGANWIKVSGF